VFVFVTFFFAFDSWHDRDVSPATRMHNEGLIPRPSWSVKSLLAQDGDSNARGHITIDKVGMRYPWYIYRGRFDMCLSCLLCCLFCFSGLMDVDVAERIVEARKLGM
jgi:hypothetical protein